MLTLTDDKMNQEKIHQAQTRWRQIEESVLATFLEEMARAPLDESEWQLVAVRCAKRLLESAEASLHAHALTKLALRAGA